MPTRINLAADLGEGFGAYTMGDDAAMLEVVSSANVACGFHAGDPRIMNRTVRRCVENGVDIGAHPGFPDLAGFGRRAIDCTPDEVYTDVLYQLGALAAFVRANGARLTHLSPHGKLGNLTRKRSDYADAVASAVADFDPALRIVTREGGLTDAAQKRGLACGFSGFADRAYGDDGELVPRHVPGAVIHDRDQVIARAIRMVTEKVVRTVSGKDVPVRCDTILLHGDTAGAVELARGVRRAFDDAGIAVEGLGSR
ncbi:5-oxoprolinase subunit PxpA [Nonomuraea sp. B5E05]|uniref:LamB/YcsF family protein n=1 Tax=Nonomuraea sp. B5E05 TaxID=3153569 RepID=UPI003260706D